MKNYRLLSLFVSFVLIFSAGDLCRVALGQKGTERTIKDTNKDTKSDSGGKTQPKGTSRTVKESDLVKVITKTEFIRVAVRANKGYLSVVAVPVATVTLTPLTPNPKKGSIIKKVIEDEDGSLNLINLLPGKYEILIEHEDYSPYTDTIQVDPARPDTFVALNKMVSKFGVVRIGGVQPGAKILFDENKINPSNRTGDDQNIVIPKVAVGKHQLKISKEGYVDFSRELEVLPGRQTFVSVILDPATVTLNISSQSGAKVYVGSEEKATIPSDGKVTIPLIPGRHSIRVSKDGYQDWKKELTLSLADKSVTEPVNLIPIPSSSEGDWQPSLGARKWFPQATGWKFDKSGAIIRGEKTVFFDTEPNRDFNIYKNFKIEFDVVFTNGKGVAWVARAKDSDNYYLFEINGPQSNNPTFHFFICKDGKLEWKDSRPIVEKINNKGDSFHIVFEARGNRFVTSMEISSAPTSKPHLVGIFQDDSFSLGGIGFCGRDQSEALLQNFIVTPLK
jgi:hypothetical protein